MLISPKRKFSPVLFRIIKTKEKKKTNYLKNTDIGWRKLYISIVASGLLRSKKMHQLVLFVDIPRETVISAERMIPENTTTFKTKHLKVLVSYINMRLGDSLMSEMSCHSSSDLFLVRVFYVQICLVLFRVTVSNACLMRTLLSIHQEHKRLKISSGSIPEKARRVYNR